VSGLEALPGLVALVSVSALTLLVGSWGLRVSRTTSDFFVASRTVRPRLNAYAVSGEYLSAASFLGIAGLMLVYGADMLWYPIGWTAGYLLLLVLVAAPLRRSGAYTLPDFAEARLESRDVRNLCSLLVVAIGWLYLLPQFEGAGFTLATTIGVPRWVGPVVVGVVVLVGVGGGGMRSITLVQAFQYWLKLTALLVPAAVLLVVHAGDDAARPLGAGDPTWSMPLVGSGGVGLYTTYSLILATFLGTMGLPHVVVRFYTNPDGGAARRTVLTVLALVGGFYLIPPVYAALGHAYGVDDDGARTVTLDLPRLALDGLGGELLTGLITAGAIAAFLSTSSGLVVAVAGVLAQDVTSRRLPEVTSFRAAAVIAVVVPMVAAVVLPDVGIAQSVGLAFAVAASTFCPLLVLGIWWRGLTPLGAIAGLLAGGAGSVVAAAWTLSNGTPVDGAESWRDVLLAQPAAWSVPLAFATMIVVSRATSSTTPRHVHRFLARLHAPEALDLDRS
jgi:Na+(H+)/acetate symporter ActP